MTSVKTSQTTLSISLENIISSTDDHYLPIFSFVVAEVGGDSLGSGVFKWDGGNYGTL
jgi:hypothetical protein